MQFLKEWILKADNQALEKFVVAISGIPSLHHSQKLNIHLYRGEESLLVYHPCTYRIDLSTECVDYEMFKAKLEQSLSSTENFQSP